MPIKYNNSIMKIGNLSIKYGFDPEKPGLFISFNGSIVHYKHIPEIQSKTNIGQPSGEQKKRPRGMSFSINEKGIIITFEDEDVAKISGSGIDFIEGNVVSTPPLTASASASASASAIATIKPETPDFFKSGVSARATASISLTEDRICEGGVAESATLNVIGTENLTIQGSVAERATINVKGTVNLTINGSVAERATINVKGTGNLTIKGGVAERATINVMGTGILTIQGSVAERATINVKEGTQINFRSLPPKDILESPSKKNASIIMDGKIYTHQASVATAARANSITYEPVITSPGDKKLTVRMQGDESIIAFFDGKTAIFPKGQETVCIDTKDGNTWVKIKTSNADPQDIYIKTSNNIDVSALSHQTFPGDLILGNTNIVGGRKVEQDVHNIINGNHVMNGGSMFFGGNAPKFIDDSIFTSNSAVIVKFETENSAPVAEDKKVQTDIVDIPLFKIDLESKPLAFTEPSTVAKQSPFEITPEKKLKAALDLHGLGQDKNIAAIKGDETVLTPKGEAKILEMILLIEESLPKKDNSIDPIDKIDQESYTLLVNIINDLEYDEDGDFKGDDALNALAICGLINEETLTCYDELQSKVMTPESQKKFGEIFSKIPREKDQTLVLNPEQIASMQAIFSALLKEIKTDKVSSASVATVEDVAAAKVTAAAKPSVDVPPAGASKATTHTKTNLNPSMEMSINYKELTIPSIMIQNTPFSLHYGFDSVQPGFFINYKGRITHYPQILQSNINPDEIMSHSINDNVTSLSFGNYVVGEIKVKNGTGIMFFGATPLTANAVSDKFEKENSAPVAEDKKVQTDIVDIPLFKIDLESKPLAFTEPSTVAKQSPFEITPEKKLKAALDLHGLGQDKNIAAIKGDETVLTPKGEAKILEMILLIEESLPKKDNSIDPIDKIDQESYTLLVNIINDLEYDEDMDDVEGDETLIVLALCGLLNQETLACYDTLRLKIETNTAFMTEFGEIFKERERSRSQIDSMKKKILQLLVNPESTEDVNNPNSAVQSDLLRDERTADILVAETLNDALDNRNPAAGASNTTTNGQRNKEEREDLHAEQNLTASTLTQSVLLEIPIVNTDVTSTQQNYTEPVAHSDETVVTTAGKNGDPAQVQDNTTVSNPSTILTPNTERAETPNNSLNNSNAEASAAVVEKTPSNSQYIGDANSSITQHSLLTQNDIFQPNKTETKQVDQINLENTLNIIIHNMQHPKGWTGLKERWLSADENTPKLKALLKIREYLTKNTLIDDHIMSVAHLAKSVCAHKRNDYDFRQTWGLKEFNALFPVEQECIHLNKKTIVDIGDWEIGNFQSNMTALLSATARVQTGKK